MHGHRQIVESPRAGLAFDKMQGAGNDFVVLDLRDGGRVPSGPELARMADRHYGIGCDQVMILLPPSAPDSLAGYRIVNGDGSDARQCGNGVRCLAAWLHRAGALTGEAVLDGPSGPVPVRVLDDGRIEVTLGAPDFRPEALPMHAGALSAAGNGWRLADGDIVFGAVSMGNPHLVIEVADVARADIDTARRLRSHSAFPEGCNVGFAQVLDRGRIRLRVIERGVGETLACGSGACAAHAWLRRHGRVDAVTTVELPGGRLGVRWSGADGDPVHLRGPTTFVFQGTWPS